MFDKFGNALIYQYANFLNRHKFDLGGYMHDIASEQQNISKNFSFYLSLNTVFKQNNGVAYTYLIKEIQLNKRSHDQQTYF